MVVYRDVEMCAGVVAQTYLLRRVLSFFCCKYLVVAKTVAQSSKFFCTDLFLPRSSCSTDLGRRTWSTVVQVGARGGAGGARRSGATISLPISNVFSYSKLFFSFIYKK